MEKIIVYLDDGGYAQQQLASMASRHPGRQAGATHWVLVACAPRMMQRVSKWVSHSARENWRAKWADKLFAQVVPPLAGRGDHVTTLLAHGPLPELARRLASEHASSRVLDLRRPRLGADPQLAPGEPPKKRDDNGSLPGTILGLGGVALVLAE